jgi:glucose-1-phosphate cytidylyltransferase
MNHCDGRADVDLVASIALCRSRCKLVTVADANPPGRWGVLDVAGPAVGQLREGPERGDAWINGGFFALEPDPARWSQALASHENGLPRANSRHQAH